MCIHVYLRCYQVGVIQKPFTITMNWLTNDDFWSVLENGDIINILADRNGTLNL